MNVSHLRNTQTPLSNSGTVSGGPRGSIGGGPLGASGAHLWADRFDGSLEDVFDLQDKVASSVAGFLERRYKPL